jgi:hypothetical protein
VARIDQLRSKWNQELFQCIAVAYEELFLLLSKYLPSPHDVVQYWPYHGQRMTGLVAKYLPTAVYPKLADLPIYYTYNSSKPYKLTECYFRPEKLRAKGLKFLSASFPFFVLPSVVYDELTSFGVKKLSVRVTNNYVVNVTIAIYSRFVKIFLTQIRTRKPQV